MKRLLAGLVALLLAGSALAQVTVNPLTVSARVSGVFVLCKSAVPVTAPADTTEDVLYTCTVPANAMGANGVLRITTRWTITNNANAKTLRVHLGGIGGVDYMGNSVSGVSAQQHQILIQNRGATNSQYGFGASQAPFQAQVAAPITSAVDTTAATTIVITGQKAVGTDTITLESVLVELI